MPRSDDFDRVTPDGTSIFEAVSALTKEMRRGKELEALYWAKQLEHSYWAYCWERLMIFAAEDVSIANPNAIAQVVALRDAYVLTKERRRQGRKARGGEIGFCVHCGAVNWDEPDPHDPERQQPDKDVLAMAVLLLARSPKCRESNHLWGMLSELEQVGWKAEVPEYALDGHTRRGLQMHRNRDERHRRWYLEWSRVIPNVGPNDVHAWHLRRMVAEGRLDPKVAEEIIAEYEANGQLVYGREQDVWPEWKDVPK